MNIAQMTVGRVWKSLGINASASFANTLDERDLQVVQAKVKEYARI